MQRDFMGKKADAKIRRHVKPRHYSDIAHAII